MEKTKWLFCLLFLVLMFGCSESPNRNPTQTILVSTNTLLPRQTATSTISSTRTPLPGSTATPQPTNTFAPTATSTPQLPVSLGTPLPAVNAPISLENVSNLKLLASYERYDPGDISVKLTFDEQFYYVASSEGIDVYDVQSRQVVRHHDITLRSHIAPDSYYANDLLISQDNARFMARVSDGKVAVYDLSGHEIYHFEFPTELYDSGGVALSPDGKYLALDICSECNGYKGQPAFKVVDIDSGKIVYEYGQTPGGEARGFYPVYSPDGKIIATQLAGQVVHWNTTDWKRVTDFSVGNLYNNRVDYSSDSTTAAIMGATDVNVWRLEDHQRLRGFKVCGDEYDPAQAIFSPDNTIIAVLNCKKINIWNIADGSLIGEQDTQFSTLTGMLLGNDGKLTIYTPKPKPGVTYAPWNSWYDNGDFRFSGTPSTLNFVSHSYPGNACIVSVAGQPNCAEGNFILGIDGKPYQAITKKNNVELRPGMDGKESPILSIKWAGLYFYPVGLDLNHRLFFYDIWTTPNSSTVYLMDTTTAKNITQWPQWISYNHIAYSPDGNLAAFYLSMNPGNRFIVYDLANRKTIFQASSPWNSPEGMSFTPDGKYLAFFMIQPGEKYDHYNLVEVGKWTNISRHSYTTIRSSYPKITIFSPDGTLFVMGYSDGMVRFYDAQNDTLVYDWRANNDSISGLAFSPDMNYIASASINGTVHIWGIWP